MVIQKIRASKLARAMECAGSLFFDLPPEEPGEQAKEGTAAGELLQWIIEGKPIQTHASNGVPITSDMHFYIPFIADEIKSKAQSPIVCEERCDWMTRAGIKITGKADAVFEVYDKSDTDLYVDDLKYGWGIVEPKENWQLIAYGIGEIIKRQKAYRNIYLRIRQPRPHHEEGDTRVWVVSFEQLMGYKEKIEARMEMIKAGLKTLQTGKNCYYCPAAGEACPAINKAFYRGIEHAQEFLQDKLDDKELSQQLQLAERIAEVIKIKKTSLEDLAIDRMKKGSIVPGYVAEASYGHRTWKPGVKPETIAALTGRKVTEEVILSPAKVEKMKVDKKFLDSFCTRPFNGQKLKRKDGSDVGNKIFGTQQPVGVTNG